MIRRTRHLPARLHRQRRRARRFDHGEPISRIDTRPMAVLATCMVALVLVLLKMPPHAFELDLWDGATAHPLILNSEPRADDIAVATNRVVLTENYTIQWNGEIITLGQLHTLLHEVGKLNPQPVVEFEPEANASYDFTAKVLYMLTTSGSEFRIAGLEKHCRFDSDYPSYAHTGGSLALATYISLPRESSNLPLFRIEACDPRYVVHRPN